jgi:hypothetical protein
MLGRRSVGGRSVCHVTRLNPDRLAHVELWTDGSSGQGCDPEGKCSKCKDTASPSIGDIHIARPCEQTSEHSKLTCLANERSYSDHAGPAP